MDLREQLQQTLGSAYSLERELGGGGMSRVFTAIERRLNRKVVIKVLSPELAAGVNVQRFEREIQLAASLQQANIVPILSAGDTNGLPFYIMPFVDGESLRGRQIRESRLDVGLVISVLRDVARALAYAHAHGVVHRDIKPDNVLLSGGTAVVTDFGIAKAITAARAAGDGATLTQVGTSIGTPAYMSPEQAAGDPMVDHRADFYSFGCMAYELLAGQSPFHGRTPARMLAAHITEAPPVLSLSRPDVPQALERLVMHCLEKNPVMRPQSGAEIVRTLDGVVSGRGDGMASSVAIDAMPPLSRALGIYAAALVSVAIVARALVSAIGVPDWVFPGALLIMLLGLPVILFTWYAQLVKSRAAAMPTPTPGESVAPTRTMTGRALKAGTRLTWRRAWIGGAITLGAFVVLVLAYLAFRAMGIGPAGSLLAAGKLEDRGRLIVTAFSSPDSSLGTLVTEAVRTNLGQSRVVSIIPPVAITAALQRMQRPPVTPLTVDLAREIALREGMKAVVDGAVRALGSGYVLSLRLVSADSAKELAAFQETAAGPQELLKTIDRLTRKLRGKIGESLRDVRGSPPLEQVTTPSLEALRVYAEAARFLDMGGSPIEGAERLREAVRLDTMFAMAYRKLGIALNNSGLPRVRVDSALERAYRFRDRLTERERLLAEGTYFHLGPGRDRRRAVRAYEALLAIDPNDGGGVNNLANILSGRRDFAGAESLFKRQIQTGRASSQQYTNLLVVLFNEGKIDEAEQLLAESRSRFPGALTFEMAPLSFLYLRGKLDSIQLVLEELAKSPTTIFRLQGVAGLGTSALSHGRVGEALRLFAQAREIQESLGQPPSPVSDSLQLAWIDLVYYDDTATAVRRVESIAAKTDFQAMPFEQRPCINIALLFATARRTARATSILAQHDAEIGDSTLRRTREPSRHLVLAAIAGAEGRHQDAVRELWRSDTAYDGPNGNCAICIFDDIGWEWSRAGAADSAIYYWEKYLSTPYYGRYTMDASQKPLMLKRLGELYQSKGDAANAARYYREFLALWSRADARLRPKVEDARFRLSRVTDLERR